MIRILSHFRIRPHFVQKEVYTRLWVFVGAHEADHRGGRMNAEEALLGNQYDPLGRADQPLERFRLAGIFKIQPTRGVAQEIRRPAIVTHDRHSADVLGPKADGTLRIAIFKADVKSRFPQGGTNRDANGRFADSALLIYERDSHSRDGAKD